jgi:LysR family glycine cleavage system transcriptional activator
MRAGQSSKSLTIAAPRDIMARWLAPRIAALAASDADLRFTLITADQPLDFTEANLDIAMRWADDAGDLEGVALSDGELTEIGPPAGNGPFRILWNAGENEAERDRATMRVGDAGLAIDAVAAGLGTALVPAFLAAPDIVAGRVRTLAQQRGATAYWLVAPTPQWRQKKVRALVEALTAR